jgi:uncharacterized protein YciI
MPYVIVGRDAPGSEVPRREHLQRHLEFVERVVDRILVAGPLLDASGRQCGSLYVLDVPDEPAARALLESDPYYAAGVWSDCSVESFRGAAGRWVGGLTWK